MHQVAKFTARAIQVGGRAIPGRHTADPLGDMLAPGWTDIMTKAVSIDGRIPIAAVESYVAQQHQSATKEVIIVQFEVEDPSSISFEKRKAEFQKLFHYFHEKNRNGVVPHKGRHVKDMYLVPVGANDPFPGYFQGLMENEAVARGADPRKDALFGVLVVNKASSHHSQHRDHQHHRDHSPSQARGSPSQHRHSSASASRPYPTHDERRGSKESSSNGYTPTIQVPRPQVPVSTPAVSSPFSVGTTATAAPAPAPAPIK
ncbi:Death-inducer obliterator 1, partial [Modicella reniformis]